MAKRQINMDAQAELQLERLTRGTGQVRPSENKARKTYTDRLSELQAMADGLADEIQAADVDVGKRLGWLKEYARILPLLERAERRHTVQVNKRGVDEMTNEELNQAVAEMLRHKAK